MNRRAQLLRVTLIFVAVMFSLVALFQLPKGLTADLSRLDLSQGASHAKIAPTLIPIPFENTVTTTLDEVNDAYGADLDGDGDIDILAGSRDVEQKGFHWWENTDGKGTTWITHTVGGNYTGTISLRADDIDNDGDIDVVGATSGTDAIVWWQNDGNGGWSPQTIGLTDTEDIEIADIDEDGDMDILSAARNGNISWWENANSDGNGSTWTPHTIATINDIKGLRDIYPIDINGDNKMDVLSASKNNHMPIIWWQNENGKGTEWTRHPMPIQLPNGLQFKYAQAVIAADVDGDGQVDILGAGDKGIAWWKNQGDNDPWLGYSVVSDSFEASAIITAKLDLDDDMDILAVGQNQDGQNSIVWWENINGNGIEWTSHTIDENFNAYSLHAPRINRDNYPDVLGAGENTVRWWQFVSVVYHLYLPIARLDPTPTPTATPTNTATPTPTDTPTPTPTCIEREEERNNSTAEADRKPPACKGVWVTGKLPEGDNDDYYRIIVDQLGTLVVDLINIPEDKDYDLYVYNNLGNQIAKSKNTGNAPEHIPTPSSPPLSLQRGTYYLRVFPHQGRSDQEYSLKWELK